MTYDARTLDGSLAVQLRLLTGAEQDVVPDCASLAAEFAVGGSELLNQLTPGFSFTLGWNFAIRAAAAVLGDPFGDGGALQPAIDDSRDELASYLQIANRDEVMVARRRQRASEN